MMVRWRFRAVAAGVVVLALIALIAWQRHRSALVRDCVASGGAWHGPESKCVPLPGAPVLQRDLRRT